MAKPALKLGYCETCKPPVALGVGKLHVAPSHVVDGKTHVAKLINIKAEDGALQPQESPKAFLDRLMKKYVS